MKTSYPEYPIIPPRRCKHATAKHNHLDLTASTCRPITFLDRKHHEEKSGGDRITP